MRLDRPLSITALLLLAAGAGGCPGGSGGGGSMVIPPPPPPPPPPTGSAVDGLWSGALTWEPSNGFPGGALNVRALVAETGEFSLVLSEDVEQLFGSQSEQVFGTFATDGATIETINGAIWSTALDAGIASGELWGAFGLAADLEEGVRINGAFRSYWTNFEERLGTLDMNYHSLYENDSSLEALQGTFTTSTESLTIDGQGVIFYQSSVAGCTGNGSAEVINPDFNMYRLEMTVGGCTGSRAFRNGFTFTGLANIGVNNEPGGGFLNDTIEMAVSASYVDGLGPSVYIPRSLLAHRQ